MTEWLFQDDAYLKNCAARIVEVLPEGIVLDRTVFYPLGGGQPGDTGVLEAGDGSRWRVLDTRKATAVTIDWDRRYLHMRMHAGLHLLGSVLRYGVTAGRSPPTAAGSTSIPRPRSTRTASTRRCKVSSPRTAR